MNQLRCRSGNTGLFLGMLRKSFRIGKQCAGTFCDFCASGTSVNLRDDALIAQLIQISSNRVHGNLKSITKFLNCDHFILADILF